VDGVYPERSRRVPVRTSFRVILERSEESRLFVSFRTAVAASDTSPVISTGEAAGRIAASGEGSAIAAPSLACCCLSADVGLAPPSDVAKLFPLAVDIQWCRIRERCNACQRTSGAGRRARHFLLAPSQKVVLPLGGSPVSLNSQLNEQAWTRCRALHLTRRHRASRGLRRPPLRQGEVRINCYASLLTPARAAIRHRKTPPARSRLNPVVPNPGEVQRMPPHQWGGPPCPPFSSCTQSESDAAARRLPCVSQLQLN
jgi:hypothetical protein